MNTCCPGLPRSTVTSIGLCLARSPALQSAVGSPTVAPSAAAANSVRSRNSPNIVIIYAPSAADERDCPHPAIANYLQIAALKMGRIAAGGERRGGADYQRAACRLRVAAAFLAEALRAAAGRP